MVARLDPDARVIFASYNIHKCIGTDRKFDPERVMEVIAEIGPDVIALQEADRRFGDRAGLLDLPWLEKRTGLVPVPVATRHAGHGWHGNVVLVRSGLVRELKQVSLPGLEPRGALVVDLDLGPGPLRRPVRCGSSRRIWGSCVTRGACRSATCSPMPPRTSSARPCSWAISTSGAATSARPCTASRRISAR